MGLSLVDSEPLFENTLLIVALVFVFHFAYFQESLCLGLILFLGFINFPQATYCIAVGSFIVSKDVTNDDISVLHVHASVVISGRIRPIFLILK